MASSHPARLVFPGFTVGVDDPRLAERLVDLGVGGFCLYGGEYREIAALTAELQSRAAAPLLFCADYEDGLATHCAGGTALSANMGLGAAGSQALAFEKGAITGCESRAIGVRWVFAPVCDLAASPANPIVNVRAFSNEPAEVVRLARAFLRGLKSEGVLGCVKHFPGHGRTVKDSHLDLPVVKTARAELERTDLVPFRELLDESGSTMTAHLLVPAMEKDKKIPYSLSADVRTTLRGTLKFDGLITTDALNMKAIADRFPELEAAKRALLGGSDLVLVPGAPEKLVLDLCEAVESDAELARAAAEGNRRLEAALAALGPAKEAGLDVVGCAAHKQAAAKMAEACLAWAGAPAPKLSGKVVYWEPETDAPDERLGAAFVDELGKNGLEVVAGDGTSVPKDAALVVGCFLSPRAYTGRITWDAATVGRTRRLLAASAGKSLIVSFGSPFVFEDYSVPGLCAFARSEETQRAAAKVLAGRLRVSGRMPVPLSIDRAR